MTKTVVGLFESIDDAQNVKHDLVNEGYAAEDMTVVANDATGEMKAAGSVQSTSVVAETGIGEKISSFFRSLTGGEPDQERYYTEGVKNGRALLAVTVPDDEADEVADVLESHGAKDVEERNVPSTPARTESAAAHQEEQLSAIPVVEEELKVGKRQVQRGGVRVYSHVTERPVEADVLLREEQIKVERRPVDRPATENDFSTAGRQNVELTETVEEAVVGKTSRVVEEVVVGKEITERNETVRDTLRKTEVDVERLGPSQSARSSNDYDTDFRNDFEANYGKSGAKYEGYVPAYKYGYELASDPRYLNSDWLAMESQARTDWSRHGEGPWEDFKAAIRSGWDRARSR